MAIRVGYICGVGPLTMRWIVEWPTLYSLGEVGHARVVGVVIAAVYRFPCVRGSFGCLPLSWPVTRALVMPSRMRRWFRFASNYATIAKVCRKSLPNGSFQSWMAVPRPNSIPRVCRSVRSSPASAMLRANRSNLVVVSTNLAAFGRCGCGQCVVDAPYPIACARTHIVACTRTYNLGLRKVPLMTVLITRNELAKEIETGSVTVIDALGAEYYAKAHLPGALNLVETDVEVRASQLLPDKDAAIVTYCSNPACPNSQQVAAKLEALGYTNVRKYREGIQDWTEAGLPVER